MRRRLAIFLVLGLLTAACGSNEPQAPEPTPESTPEPTPEPEEPGPEPTALCDADGDCLEDQGYATLTLLPVVGVAPYHIVGDVAYVLTSRGVVRYDGETWSLESVDVDTPWGIGGPSEGEPIVVGREGTILEREDAGWRVVHEGSVPGTILDGVWIRGADNGWAEVRREDDTRRLMHWDGEGWSTVAPLAEVEDATSLAPVSPDWAVVVHSVGDTLRTTVVEHSQADGWTGRVAEGDSVESVWVGADDRVLGVRGDAVVALTDTRWETVHEETSVRRFGFVTGNGERVVAIGQGLAEAGGADTALLQRVLVGDGESWSLSDPMPIVLDRAVVLPDRVVLTARGEESRPGLVLERSSD